jgi:WD40 repeat protein
MPAIFISHSSEDRAATDRIKSALDSLNYEQIFLDYDTETGIGLGENWERRLYHEIKRCHVVILALTPNWIKSKWCFVEYAQARALGKEILPIICAPIDKNIVMPEIQAVDVANLDGPGLVILSKKLLEISGELARGFPLDPNRPPYPGIHAFEAQDAAIFFGRDEEIRAVIERLDARCNQGGNRFLVIVGASGSGKSSLLRAGVLPQLKRRNTQWIVLPIVRPERTPLQGLAKSIALHLKKPDEWRSWYDLLKDDQKAVHHIKTLLEDLRVSEASSITVLLPIDQFEEIFTIAEPEERACFVRLLTTLLNPALQLPLMAVATGRSDVLQGLLESGELGQLCETLQLGPMPVEHHRISRLVEGPAGVAGLVVEPGLTQRIFHHLETAEALPLLAYTLYLLYQKSLEDHDLTIEKYQKLGDEKLGLNPIQNSVRLVADDAVVNFTADELSALRDVFIPYLVRVRLDDGRRVRQQARIGDLPKGSERLIEKLTDARLLSQSNQVVEVTHEALFKAWPTLDDWLTQEQDFLNDLERLRAYYDVWRSAADKDKKQALLHGLLLSKARDWVARYPQRFLGEDMEALCAFIALSEKNEQDEKDRINAQEIRSARLRWWLFRGAIVAAVGLAIIAGVAVFETIQAIGQRNTAETNQSLLLVATAKQRYADYDYATAMAFSLEALPGETTRRPYVASAESMLYQSVTALREQHLLNGHADQVHSAIFSPDGHLVLTAAWDKTARIWNADTGELVRELKGHRGRLDSAVFSPDASRVVTASWDNTARVWNTADGQEVAKFTEHSARVTSALFSFDGRRIVTASEDKTARIWDAKTGKQIHMLPHDDVVEAAAFSPDGKFVVTASADMTAAIWNADTGERIHTLTGHNNTVFVATFSPDGTKIVTGSFDYTAKIWNAATGEEIATLTGHTKGIQDATFSPDGQQIVTASEDKTAKIWNADDGSLIATLPGPNTSGHTKYVVKASFSPDGRHVVTASQDGTARIWNASDGALEQVLRGHTEELFSVAWSPDSHRVVTASLDRTARIWVATGPAEVVALRGHEGPISAIAYSRDGKWLATASDDTTARVWDTKTGVEVAKFSGHTEKVSAIAFSPNGKTVASGSADGTAFIWDATTGKPMTWNGAPGKPAGKILGQANPVASIEFSPDGKNLLVAYNDSMPRLYNVDTGNQIGALVGHTAKIQSALYSPDGKWIATASNDNTARVWDAANGSPVAEMKGHTNWVLSVAFSPDGKRIATGSQDQTARVWDAQTGKLLANLTGHSAQVQSAEFSPDGNLVVTASWDKTARIWDARTGGSLQELKGHSDHVEEALFLPDGKRVVTVSSDRTGRIWDVASGDEVAVLRGHDQAIHDMALAPGGKRLATASDDRTVRIWPIFATTRELVEHAHAITPRR